MDRTTVTAHEVVALLWQHLDLPPSALDSLHLPGDSLAPAAPSSFRLGILAQASIALSALSAALVHTLKQEDEHANENGHKNNIHPPKVTIPLPHALAEFKSQDLLTLNGLPLTSTTPSPSAPKSIGGLHATLDGHVRIHDSFAIHRARTKTLLQLPTSGPENRDLIASRVALWPSLDFEAAAAQAGLAAAALRSYAQWDATPQAQALGDFPISLCKVADAPAGLPPSLLRAGGGSGDKCLRGLRVVELTRVIAGPVAGRTLAAHGADVIWVTSAGLEDQPSLDRDMGRGKRTVRLDLGKAADFARLENLLADADVFLQSYRPGSLARRGLSPEKLAAMKSQSQKNKSKKTGIITASLSAYGPSGPWSQRRGFDSLVQTCSGLNVSEAQHAGQGEMARPLPCQALDHASGYFLAAGIAAAVYRQAREGGSWDVSVSLAGTGKFLRGLGQFEGDVGFREGVGMPKGQEDVDAAWLEDRECGFGVIRGLKHSAQVVGVEVGWDIMPKPLGEDRAEWLVGEV